MNTSKKKTDRKRNIRRASAFLTEKTPVQEKGTKLTSHSVGPSEVKDRQDISLLKAGRTTHGDELSSSCISGLVQVEKNGASGKNCSLVSSFDRTIDSQSSGISVDDSTFMSSFSSTLGGSSYLGSKKTGRRKKRLQQLAATLLEDDELVALPPLADAALIPPHNPSLPLEPHVNHVSSGSGCHQVENDDSTPHAETSYCAQHPDEVGVKIHSQLTSEGKAHNGTTLSSTDQKAPDNHSTTSTACSGPANSPQMIDKTGKQKSCRVVKDVGLQTDLCRCPPVHQACQVVETRYQDASLQACLCHCTEIVKTDDDLVEAMSKVAIADSVTGTMAGCAEDCKANNTGKVGCSVRKQRRSSAMFSGDEVGLDGRCDSTSAEQNACTDADMCSSFITVCDESIQTSHAEELLVTDQNEKNVCSGAEMRSSFISVCDESIQTSHAEELPVTDQNEELPVVFEQRENEVMKASFIASFITSGESASSPSSSDGSPLMRIHDNRISAEQSEQSPSHVNAVETAASPKGVVSTDSFLDDPADDDAAAAAALNSTSLKETDISISAAAFFGFAQSLIDSDDSPAVLHSDVRRKSKRVSMCGMYESSGSNRRKTLNKRVSMCGEYEASNSDRRKTLNKRVSMCGEYEANDDDREKIVSKIASCSESETSDDDPFCTPDSVRPGNLTTVVSSDEESEGNAILYKTSADVVIADTPPLTEVGMGLESPNLTGIAHDESMSNSDVTGRQADARSPQSSDSDEDFEKFLQKTKASSVKEQKPKPTWTAPVSDFIVPDDNFLTSEDSDNDTEIEDDLDDLGSPGKSDKENHKPVDVLPGRSLRTSVRKRVVNEDIHPAGKHVSSPLQDKEISSVDDTPFAKFAVPYPVTVPMRCPSDDLSCRTPLNDLPRHKTAKAPHTVGHCYLSKFGFLKSLSQSVPEYQRDIDAARFVKQFSKLRTELTAKLFSLYNMTVFESKLPDNMPIIWNSRLTKTAGYCRYKADPVDRTQKNISIELSTKVCDSAERLRDTLIHELCHAIVWVEHKVIDGHGSFWKHWAKRANRILTDLPSIKRCHSYEINTKYVYKCTKCGYEVHRHSKSLDIEAKVCGYCRSPFQLLHTKALGTPNSSTSSTPRTPNQFAMFVKDNYASVKRSQPNMKHCDVMQELKLQYHAEKKAKALTNNHIDLTNE